MQQPTHDPRSDLELIAAVNGCDPEAFAALYGRYRDWVVDAAWRITGDRDLALDVLQETFLYFLRKFPGFFLTCQLKTFLHPVVRNLSIAARRKAQRCQSEGTALEELEAPPAAEVQGAMGPCDGLAAALAALSAEHREVLTLRFVDDLSLNEIAEALEVPLGTVKSRLHHALENLRQNPQTKAALGG